MKNLIITPRILEINWIKTKDGQEGKSLNNEEDDLFVPPRR